MNRAIAAFAVVQMIGWGTTIYLPAVLLDRLRDDLGLSAEVIFAGVSIMLLVSALAAPFVGRAYDRHGTRGIMTAGAVLLGIGLFALSQSRGFALYAAGWGLIGLGMCLSLTFGMSTTYARLYGGDTRRLITVTTLFTGVTSTLFLPFTEWAATHYGWRATVAGYALLCLLVSVPVYLWVIPWNGSSGSGKGEPDAAADPEPMVAPDDIGRALAILGFSMALANLVSWGMLQQMIELMKDFGMSAALAALVVGLKGPAQAAGRIGDLVFARRLSSYRGMVGCLAMMAISLGGLAVLPFGLGVALVFIVAWGIAEGMMTILRSALPLQLFGRARYGSLMGRILMPMQITSAFAPIIFAAIMERLGGVALLAFAALTSAVATGAMLLLGRMIRPAKPREM